ncbi:MAG: DegV family protein [Acidimicrobiales bacterium]|nr:DegV family protein [Acidimicrobiales bacterium]
MAGIRVVTDSSCDLPQGLADELGIRIVPLTIRFGGDELVDRRDLTASEFWRRCAASPVLPETAAPAPGQFEEAYRAAAAEGADGVVAICLSGALSATLQAADAAGRAVADVIPVRTVDSRSVTMGLGMIAVEAARRGRDGAALDEVVAVAGDLAARTRVYGALDTLENLKKGGRIGSAQALLGSLLSIKPIIEVRDGKVEPEGKQRTRTRALAYLADKVRSQGKVENLAVMHADAPDVDEFVASLRPLYAGEIVVGDIGPVIGTHSGPGAMGVVFQVPA